LAALGGDAACEDVAEADDADCFAGCGELEGGGEAELEACLGAWEELEAEADGMVGAGLGATLAAGLSGAKTSPLSSFFPLFSARLSQFCSESSLDI